MIETDYKKLLVEDTYDLIVMRKNPWPISWTRARKIKMITEMIEYFEEQNEFEKCQILKDIQKDIYAGNPVKKTKK
jgi:hypothetical protein